MGCVSHSNRQSNTRTKLPMPIDPKYQFPFWLIPLPWVLNFKRFYKYFLSRWFFFQQKKNGKIKNDFFRDTKIDFMVANWNNFKRNRNLKRKLFYSCVSWNSIKRQLELAKKRRRQQYKQFFRFSFTSFFSLFVIFHDANGICCFIHSTIRRTLFSQATYSKITFCKRLELKRFQREKCELRATFIYRFTTSDLCSHYLIQ